MSGKYKRTKSAPRATRNYDNEDVEPNGYVNCSDIELHKVHVAIRAIILGICVGWTIVCLWSTMFEHKAIYDCGPFSVNPEICVTRWTSANGICALQVATNVDHHVQHAVIKNISTTHARLIIGNKYHLDGPFVSADQIYWTVPQLSELTHSIVKFVVYRKSRLHSYISSMPAEP